MFSFADLLLDLCLKTVEHVCVGLFLSSPLSICCLSSTDKTLSWFLTCEESHISLNTLSALLPPLLLELKMIQMLGHFFKTLEYYLFFGCMAYGILFSHQKLNPHPLWWKCGVLATSMPGKVPKCWVFVIVPQVPKALLLFLFSVCFLFLFGLIEFYSCILTFTVSSLVYSWAHLVRFFIPVIAILISIMSIYLKNFFYFLLRFPIFTVVLREFITVVLHLF